jgi:hypothetical protein
VTKSKPENENEKKRLLDFMLMRYIDTSYIQPISKKDAQKERKKKKLRRRHAK